MTGVVGDEAAAGETGVGAAEPLPDDTEAVFIYLGKMKTIDAVENYLQKMNLAQMRKLCKKHEPNVPSRISTELTRDELIERYGANIGDVRAAAATVTSDTADTAGPRRILRSNAGKAGGPV